MDAASAVASFENGPVIKPEVWHVVYQLFHQFIYDL